MDCCVMYWREGTYPTAGKMHRCIHFPGSGLLFGAVITVTVNNNFPGHFPGLANAASASPRVDAILLADLTMDLWTDCG